jgi:cytosine/adenosine deaminase-related metal-dependent hydrolase
VAPLERPIIQDGAVAILAERIAAVGVFHEIRGVEDVIDVGDVVLLPGFANAHTHLELSHLAGRVPPMRASSARQEPRPPALIEWLDRLMQARAEAGDDVGIIESAIKTGLDASIAAGVIALGDITRLPNISRPLLRDAGVRVVSFGEVTALGQRRHLLDERLAAAVDMSCSSPTLSVALSPHAPYSVEPEGLRACAETARRLGLRSCVHVAESAEEAEFTLRRSGPFCQELRRLGIWDDAIPCSGLRPIPLLDQAGLLGETTLLAHANYASDEDIALLAARGAHVAYCPRTHAAFGHIPHPWRRMLAAGVNVAIGTDSLASNPSLSVLDELRFLHAREPDAPAQDLLRLGTVHAARALGLQKLVGTITTGKLASLVAIPLSSKRSRDPLTSLLESPAQPSAVWIDGRRVL